MASPLLSAVASEDDFSPVLQPICNPSDNSYIESHILNDQEKSTYENTSTSETNLPSLVEVSQEVPLSTPGGSMKLTKRTPKVHYALANDNAPSPPEVSTSSPSVEELIEDRSKYPIVSPSCRPIQALIRARRRLIFLINVASYRISDCIFSYPILFMSIFTLISLILSTGFFLATLEEDVYKLYALPKSDAHEHAKLINEKYSTNRPNFIMFNNHLGPNELFSDESCMAALWAIDHFVQKRMTIPRVLHADGIDPGHRIWAFLDSAPSDDAGYFRYSDVCAVRPPLNRGVDTERMPRTSSAVYSEDWSPESSLDPTVQAEIDDNNHCDYVTSMSAWKRPRFRRRGPGGTWLGAALRTQYWPFYATTWNQRALNLPLAFFKPTYEVTEDPETGDVLFHTVTDAAGMMFLYYTEACTDGVDCESKLWERGLIDLITNVNNAYSDLLDSPYPGLEPLVWVDYGGSVVKQGWFDCSNRDTRLRISSNGSLICDSISDQPPHAILLNVRGLDLSVYGANSWSDELARSTAFDYELMMNYIASFSILLIYGSLSMTSRNVYRSKTLVGIAGAVSGLLGYLAGAGFCYLCGLKHTATMNAVPFLAMGIAMDDSFVMINSYAMTYYMESHDEYSSPMSREEKIELSRHRCNLSLTESSLAITLTTLTNLVSFSVGSISPYFAARNFCIVCVFGLLGGYIGAFMFFWPVVCMMAKFEHLRPPPPLLMEKALNKCGIRTVCSVPSKVPSLFDRNESHFRNFHVKDIVNFNAMVTNRHYRVIRFSNEIARRDIVNQSLNITQQFRTMFTRNKSKPSHDVHLGEASLRQFHSPTMISFRSETPSPGESLHDLSEDFLSCASGHPVTTVLPSPSALKRCSCPSGNPSSALQGSIPPVDSRDLCTKDLCINDQSFYNLRSLAHHARADYNAVKPPPGTLSRGVRSLIVRVVTSCMRKSHYRWAVVSVFSCLFVWMVYQISTNFSTGLEQLNLVPPDSYLNDSYAMSEQNEIYLIEGQFMLMVTGGHRFSETAVQSLYIDLSDTLASRMYISSTIDPIGIFHEWMLGQMNKPRIWQKISADHAVADFDGSLEIFEYEQALLYWNINKAEGTQMNKYLVWSQAGDGNSRPWLDPSENRLEAVMISYFNNFYPDVSDQSRYFKALRMVTDDFNAQHGHMLKAVEYNSLHPFFESDDIIVRQTLVSMGGALIGIGVVTCLLMDSDSIMHSNSFLVISMIILMDVTVFGLMAMIGIKLNIITMILLVMSIGFSVDHSLHTAHQYVHMKGNVLERLAMTMVYIGLPLFQGLMSTILASLPLTTRLDEYIFSTFFEMILIVLIVGFIYGVILLPQILVIIDRMKGELEAEKFKNSVHMYQKELTERRCQTT
eukprot:GHVH01000940.1.p1 GENE.GHVH01000940.1~~GHVH01000940.1.p1  ORF type:complete len:1371 (+),score=216.11 GHVH01000940.1:159-4271(+)